MFAFDEGGGEEYEAATHRSATDNKICEMRIHIRTNALYLYEYVSIFKKICPTHISVRVDALQIYVYATYFYATYFYATCGYTMASHLICQLRVHMRIYALYALHICVQVSSLQEICQMCRSTPISALELYIYTTYLYILTSHVICQTRICIRIHAVQLYV